MHRFSEQKSRTPCRWLEGAAGLGGEPSGEYGHGVLPAARYSFHVAAGHPPIVWAAVYPLSHAAGGPGIVIPADTYLGGASGQGGGTADPAAGQSSALVFLPISHTEWENVDGQVLTLYGPEGVTIRDAGSKTTFLLTPQSITIASPEQFKVTVGSTVLTLTNGSWSLTGQSGTLADGQASTSPAIMHEGWQQLLTG